MSKFISFMFALSVGIAAAGLTPSMARADLVEKDLNAEGDGLITLNTDTGFEWLDVTATLGLSYNEAEATTFVTESDFRHATVKEVRDLYEAAGITTLCGKYTHDNFDGAALILKLLGRTGELEDSTGEYTGRLPAQAGWSDLEISNPNTAVFSIVQLDLSLILGSQAAVCDDAIFTDKDTRDADVGNYLVRQSPIPKP